MGNVVWSPPSPNPSFLVFFPTSPSNLFTYQMGADQAVQLTQNGNPKIQSDDLVAGEVKRFKSFDGLEIPGILYKPKQAATQKVPALSLKVEQ